MSSKSERAVASGEVEVTNNAVIRLTGAKKKYPFGGICKGTGYKFLAEKNYSAFVCGDRCRVVDENGDTIHLIATPRHRSITGYDYMISHPADWNGAAYFNVLELN